MSVAAANDAAQAELRRHYLATLARTQYLPPTAMARYQASLLEPLLRHAVAEVPFYRDGRLAPVLNGGGGLNMDRWHEVPILTREAARAAGAALHAERMPAMMGGYVASGTSGSTGSPFRFLFSDIAAVATQCCLLRHYRAHGIPDDAPIAFMRHAQSLPTEETALADLPMPQEDGRPTPHFNTSRHDLDPLAWLAAANARYLVAYPTYVRDLARAILSGRARPVSLERVFAFGEVLIDETRDEIARAFGAVVVDRYAAEETGMLAGECPEGGRHVQSEINLVEIVDGDGKPVPAGVEGDVAVTVLYSYAMPLIRYRIGDRASLSPTPCSCGRTLPVLGRVAGRSRDLFRFANGRGVWPFIPFAELRRFIEMRQAQMIQVALGEVEVHYVPEGGGGLDEDGATRFICRCLGGEMTIRFVARTEIPRLPNGKYLDYISRVPLSPPAP